MTRLRASLTCTLALALPALLASAAPAGARSLAPRVLTVHCAPTPVAPCPAATVVQRGGKLQLAGRHLIAGFRVVFPRRPSVGRRAVTTAVLSRTKRGLIVVVPVAAASGRLYVVGRGMRSNRAGPVRVIDKPKPLRAPQAGPSSGSVATPLATQGMWIWQLDRSSGGDLDAIAARAAASGVTTIYLKSSDGNSGLWSQFSPSVVSGLQARGLHVCGWEFVYGTHPDAEAQAGAAAKAAGAECLIIDAEDQYDGKYAEAQSFMSQLRAAVGPAYPLGLTSFPYVDYHPSLPFSVFLGPGGVDANLPQMYWKDIGVSVDTVYQHAYAHNQLFGRPILPLGQTYSSPPPADIVRFRQLAADFGAVGLSFFSWQETTASGWDALARPLAAPQPAALPSPPVLAQGAKGDEVVWLQEHLAAEQPNTPVNGVFDAATTSAMQAFQQAHSLPVTGQADAATWPVVLALTPVAVTWTDGKPRPTATRAMRSPRARRTLGPPRSAHLPSRREFRARRRSR